MQCLIPVLFFLGTAFSGLFPWLSIHSFQEKSVQYFSSLSEEKTPQLMIDLSQLLTSASIITKLPPYAQPETETFLRVQGKKRETTDMYRIQGEYYLPADTVVGMMGDSADYNVLDNVMILQTSSDHWEFAANSGRIFKNGKWISLNSGNRLQNKIYVDSEVFYLPVSFIKDRLKYPVKINSEHDQTIIAIGKEPEYPNPLNVPLLNQMDDPRLYNGCEVTSLAMILNYSGIDVSKNEAASQLPRVPLTYNNGLKGNPNAGFVGNLEDGPGLSVYHGPIFTLAKEFAGDSVKDLTGNPVQKLYQQIDRGFPVWIMTNTEFQPVHNWESWSTPQGEIKVTFSVHSAVITGYSKRYVYINNPYGQKNQQLPRDDFERAWKQMGSQAIVVQKHPQTKSD